MTAQSKINWLQSQTTKMKTRPDTKKRSHYSSSNYTDYYQKETFQWTKTNVTDNNPQPKLESERILQAT